ASAAVKPNGPIPLAQGWQLALDPTDAGLSQRWQDPSVPLPDARAGRTGTSLFDQGIPEYKGYAWLKRRVAVPDGWQRVVVGFGAVDVAAQLYVDGILVGEWDDATLGAQAALVDLTGIVAAGRPFTLAFRVRGEGGFGGIKQTVILGDDESKVMTGQQYGQWLHNRHPDWRLLPWMAGGRRAWTIVGQEGAAARAVVASDGSFSPWAGAWSVTPWLYDRDAGGLVDFGPPTASLVDGSLPLPVFTFSSGPWRFEEELLPSGTPASPGVEVRYTLLAGPGPADLYLAARPYTASGGIAPITSGTWAGDFLHLNGFPALEVANAEGGLVGDGDGSVLAASGGLPLAQRVTSGNGRAQALLRVPLAAGQAVVALAPSIAGQPVPADVDPNVVATQWRQRVQQVQLDLPDQRLQAAFYASLSYILESESSGRIHPGPLLHDAFWVRDAALIGYALERAGLANAVRGSAEAILQATGPDGQVHAITDPNGQPRPDVEWDAPGEAAFALVEYARYSGDSAFLQRAYPKISAALDHGLAARGSDGLLPANESAEDLGPATQQHYWDDLWLLTGLQEAHQAATQIGVSDAYEQAFQKVEASLRASIVATGSDVIPGGPGDLTSSAMARGTTPALWPVSVLDATDPLLQRSFEAYFQRFMPNGAYRHLYGQWWPYGGLEVAHALLFLDHPNQALQTLSYSLDHQTFPDLFAWSEGADPATSDFAEGDMPHGWASAELVNLVRDMLLYEAGDKLVVGAGVPPSWAGQAFWLRNAPTRWGRVDLTVSATGDVSLSGAAPPGGVELRLPFPARLT
ncbi:MAG: hypothetical protein JO247_15530, partial [Chloroflexi bacterium]|nr:hypothetical protein [Chloroflexota bacterium]